MLKIRLQRVGRKHEPVFRLVLTDSQNSTKSGRYLEMLGSHDPRKENKTEFKIERVKYWISKGAQPSDTVHNLLVSQKVIDGKKINVLPKKTPIKKEGGEAAPAAAAPEAPVAPATETPAQ
jgi:small subunit ribosomal protein S16